MQELGCSVGGEESGHMVVADYSKSGDGMVNALLVCLAWAASGKRMSEIFPLFKFDPYVFVSVSLKDRAMVAEAAASEKVKAAVSEAENIMSGKGRVVLHPSGTEPKLRVWVSGSDETLVKKSADMIIAEINKLQEE